MKTNKKTRSNWLSMPLTILLALCLRWGVAEAYVIPSGSMLPSLLIHDHIFVNKFIYGIRVPFSKTWLVQFKKPERGEVVVFKDPRDSHTTLIKRVIGLPGDKIEYRQNQLYINDQLITNSITNDNLDLVANRELENQKPQHELLTENLGMHPHPILHIRAENDMESGPFYVPANSYFMMGDHRDNSADSRVWGFAPAENILGRAMFVWMSCSKSLGIEAVCDPTRIRWQRTFHSI